MPVEHRVEPLAVVVLDEMAKLMEHDIVDAVTRSPDERRIEVDGAQGRGAGSQLRQSLRCRWDTEFFQQFIRLFALSVPPKCPTGCDSESGIEPTPSSAYVH